MSTAPQTVTEAVIPEPRMLLRRINARIVVLRRAIRHDHRDETYWAAFGIGAPTAQAERVWLRALANTLHVMRATARARLHGSQFASLAAQQAWLPEDHAAWRRRATDALDRLRPIGAP